LSAGNGLLLVFVSVTVIFSRAVVRSNLALLGPLEIDRLNDDPSAAHFDQMLLHCCDS